MPRIAVMTQYQAALGAMEVTGRIRRTRNGTVDPRMVCELDHGVSNAHRLAVAQENNLA
jgi:hypothetical protein